MFLVRSFEELLLKLFSEGKIFGTTHTYVGQEAIAASVISNLDKDDIVFSNHRCHGHYLCKEDDPLGLLAEIMGKEKGVCGGRGGSQHLHKNNFYSNGIQGGFLPNALGMAYAEKYFNTGRIVVAFIGDGTLGQGIVYETLNLASLWKVPLMIVLENNGYAQTTPIEKNLSGSIRRRAEAFDLAFSEHESNDVEVLYPHFKKSIELIRNSNSPRFEVVHTYRYNAHSKGDDFRDPNEIAFWKEKDPLNYVSNRIDEAKVSDIEKTVSKRLKHVVGQVESMPLAGLRI